MYVCLEETVLLGKDLSFPECPFLCQVLIVHIHSKVSVVSHQLKDFFGILVLYYLEKAYRHLTVAKRLAAVKQLV